MINAADKKELRRYFSEVRKNASCREADVKITERLTRLEALNNADTVLLFASYKSEPSTWELASYLLEKNIPVAYPRCGSNGEMTFYSVGSTDELISGKYGIREPSDKAAALPRITDKTVCIVPGLSFTENGARLGYGGGYYDRFLAKYPELFTIALAYEKCIADNLPCTALDIKIKSIVTEERMVFCNE